MPYKKIALSSVAGGLLTGVCTVIVLLMAREPMASSFFWKFLGGCAGAGLLLGAVVGLAGHYSRQERLAGIGNAIYLSLIPLIIGALSIGALRERLSGEDRRYVFATMACTVGWWLLVFAGGIMRARGSRWGDRLQLFLWGMPILVVFVGVLWVVATQSPRPEGFWSHWNGTRLVGVTILMPVCIVGLLMCLLDGGLALLVGGFAAALMFGALIGEFVMRAFGWPIAGAFSGGILSVAALVFVVARSPRKRQRITPQPPPHC
jgi:hypothetical protein